MRLVIDFVHGPRQSNPVLRSLVASRVLRKCIRRIGTGLGGIFRGSGFAVVFIASHFQSSDQ
jgi:hypothetical protein